MILIWGTQLKQKKLGHTADFCPTCRQIRQFKVSKLGMADHIFFVSLGMKNVLAHHGECTTCKQVRKVDAMTYKAFVKRPSNSIETTIAETFPDVRTVYADRLRLEQQLAAGDISPENREMLIMEVFQLFNNTAEQNFHSFIQIKGRGGWSLLATFVIGFLLFIVANALVAHPEMRGWIASVLPIAFVTGLFVSIVLILLEPGRTFRNQIIPAMGKALLPFHLTQEELNGILRKLKQSGYKIGKKARPQKLWKALQQSAQTIERFPADP